MQGITLSRDQITKIVKSLSATSGSYLQRLDQFAKIAGYENQAAMMARLKSDDPKTPAAASGSPSDAAPPPLTRAEMSSLANADSDIRQMPIEKVLRELRDIRSQIAENEDWAGAITAFRSSEAGNASSKDEAALISRFSNDLKNHTPEQLDTELSRATSALDELHGWEESLMARKRLIEIRLHERRSKPFRAVMAFGTSISSIISSGEVIPRDFDGDLSEVSFGTAAELSAYLKGADDASGWMDHAIAATSSGNSVHGNDENPEYFEQSDVDLSLTFRSWFNAKVLSEDEELSFGEDDIEP